MAGSCFPNVLNAMQPRRDLKLIKAPVDFVVSAYQSTVSIVGVFKHIYNE